MRQVFLICCYHNCFSKTTHVGIIIAKIYAGCLKREDITMKKLLSIGMGKMLRWERKNEKNNHSSLVINPDHIFIPDYL